MNDNFMTILKQQKSGIRHVLITANYKHLYPHFGYGLVIKAQRKSSSLYVLLSDSNDSRNLYSAINCKYTQWRTELNTRCDCGYADTAITYLTPSFPIQYLMFQQILNTAIISGMIFNSMCHKRQFFKFSLHRERIQCHCVRQLWITPGISYIVARNANEYKIRKFIFAHLLPFWLGLPLLSRNT